MLDPYLRVIARLNQQKLNYLIIGVSGINYYARDARQVIMTADYDIFLQPELKNVLRAMKVMRSLGYEISVNDRLLKNISSAFIQEIVKKRKTLFCENPQHNLVEFCLEVSGYTFEELKRNSRLFKAGRVKIPVGNLEDLLRMKRIAGRPKDKIFLEKHRSLIKEWK